MPLPDDKTTLNFVLDKSLKHKLQILADSEARKLGNYVALVMEQHIIDFEKQILDTYGEDDFLHEYYSIFGTEYNPHSYEQTDKDYDRLLPQNQSRGVQRALTKIRNERVHDNSSDHDFRIFSSHKIHHVDVKYDINEITKNWDKSFVQQLKKVIMFRYFDKMSEGIKKSDSPEEAIENLRQSGVTPEMILLLLSNPPFSDNKPVDTEHSTSKE